MKYLISATFFISLITTLCLAHPIDDPIPQGLQPLTWATGLQDPKFFTAHKTYWHERRLLVGRIHDLVELRGYKRGQGVAIPGWLDAQIETLKVYWRDGAPAHPVIDTVQVYLSCNVGGVQVNQLALDWPEILDALKNCQQPKNIELLIKGDILEAQVQAQAARDTLAITNTLYDILNSL